MMPTHDMRLSLSALDTSTSRFLSLTPARFSGYGKVFHNILNNSRSDTFSPSCTDSETKVKQALTNMEHDARAESLA